MDLNNLDWRSIAGTVAPIAPKLGQVLGAGFGPFGGIVGGLAGQAIASWFGTAPTPEAVGRAIAEDPAAGEKLAQLEASRGEEILAQAQAEIERLKQQTEQFRIGVADTAETRQIFERLAQAKSPLAWAQIALACIIVLSFFSLVALVVMRPESIRETPTLALVMGALVAAFSAVINYFFGSSAGSKDKDIAMKQITAVAMASPPVPALRQPAPQMAPKRR